MMSIRIALRAPLMFIFSIIMTLIQSPQMSWIFAITIPILLCVIILVMYFAIPLFNKLFKRYDSLNESIEENVRGIRVVKTYVREEYEKAKFDRVSDDLEKGFIKAEVYSYDDIKKYGSELALKEAGKLRMEGKSYIMQDGDIAFFRFNV